MVNLEHGGVHCGPITQGIDLLPNNLGTLDMTQPLSFIIFGASGDLAKKKLYPGLFELHSRGLIPAHSNIIGYARSAFNLLDFLGKQAVNVKGTQEQKEAFFKRCDYFQGGYDDSESFIKLDALLRDLEGEGTKGNRVYFLSVPPTIFGTVCNLLKAHAESKTGYTHVIIEKPFGRDSESFEKLDNVTSALFKEEQLFRIDHYLGKEVVLNLTFLRFCNAIFEPLWSNQHIESVQLAFKEDIGTQGRGGYFDEFGIIRDIMQNHLLQVLMFLAMEEPKGFDRDNLMAEKVKLLKSVKTLTLDNTVLGQYGGRTYQSFGQTRVEPSYLEDPTVPAGSKCPTYAMVRFEIDNDRWRGVPFIMSAGKALDERLTEVRITFKKKPVHALGATGEQLPSNELVMRIQPDEAIYYKVLNRQPGFGAVLRPTVLDLSYASAFGGLRVADAYERMFYNAARGDGSLFVGSEELKEAWRIFTPLLQAIESSGVQPDIYPFGSRGPAGIDTFASSHGIKLACTWEEYLGLHHEESERLNVIFRELDRDNDGSIDSREVTELVKRFYDGRVPTREKVQKVLEKLDTDSDGRISWDEFQKGVPLLVDWNITKAQQSEPQAAKA